MQVAINPVFPSSNPSLEYDERFAAVEAAWNEDATDQEGGLPGRSAPDWERVANDAEALLAESADLRLACWALRANLKCEGLSALLSGAARILNFLDTFGSRLHPMADEGHPASAHASALAWFGTPRCLHEVCSARLSPHDDETLRDLIEQRDSRPEDWRINGDILRDTALILETIERRVNEHATGYAIDIAPLAELLRKAIPVRAADPERHVPLIGAGEGVGERAVSPDSHACRTREEAHRLLDCLAEYFRVNEPSHPAPIFLRRIQKTMGMDFAGIVNELIPEAVPDLSRLTGA